MSVLLILSIRRAMVMLGQNVSYDALTTTSWTLPLVGG